MAGWLQRTGQMRGAVAGLQRTYDLSRTWYEDRAAVSWEPFGAEEAEAVFRRHGLVGPFWSLT